MLRQMTLGLVSFILIATSTAFAQDARWEALLDKIRTEGEYIPTQFGDFMTLAKIVPNDREKDRVASYISGVGSLNPDGVYFAIGHLEVVWEDWKLISDDTFAIDQWLFGIRVDGSIYRKSRSIVKIKKSGTYVGSEYPPTTEDELEKKWNTILNEWYSEYGL